MINSRPFNQCPDIIYIFSGPKGEPVEVPLRLTPLRFTAITFCVLDPKGANVIIRSVCYPHKHVYNALMGCAAQKDRTKWPKILSSYRCKIIRGRLTKTILDEFSKKYVTAHGFPRYRVISGRVWPCLHLQKIGPFSVVSFWNPRRMLSKSTIRLVAKTFGVQEPYFLATARDSRSGWCR